MRPLRQWRHEFDPHVRFDQRRCAASIGRPAGRGDAAPARLERIAAAGSRAPGPAAGPPHALAPALTVDDQRIIEEMLERSVQVPAPTEAECRRYFEARRTKFIAGAMVHARHILFAVTGGVDVHKLVARAEQALLELSRKEVAPGRFAELARQLSNCPSGADGGDLGWITPEDCAGELATELFHGNRHAPMDGPAPPIGAQPLWFPYRRSAGARGRLPASVRGGARPHRTAARATGPGQGPAPVHAARWPAKPPSKACR